MSTLGNPNYVAGYLLILIPFVTTLHTPERWIYSGIITLALLSTGSYIGVMCYIGYLMYRGVDTLLSKKLALAFLGGFFFIVCIV